MIFTPWQKFKIRKAQEANLEKRNSGSYETSTVVGILYHNDDQAKIDAVEKLATLIKMDGKKVKIIAYEHRNSIKHLPYETFSRTNFDFWGRFVGKPLQDFVRTEFDFLVCLDKEPNTFIMSVLANSQAKCRIGLYREENQHTFEMLFDNPDGGNMRVDKLYDYLKRLA